MRAFFKKISQFSEVLFFIGGFAFDVVTLVRIDSVADLVYQSVYLLLITFVMIRQFRFQQGLWAPTGWLAKAWKYESEALHFFYGGLLSAYVIFYFKSSTASRSLVFLTLVTLLMFANEMPQVRRAGHFMRLGLYAFCVASYLNYLIPVLIGRMGTWVFALSMLVTTGITVWVVRYLSTLMPDPRAARWRLGWSPAVVMVLIVTLYCLKWIPPVPLSVQYMGVFHAVERDGDHYKLSYVKPAWYHFWREDDRPFLARPGDPILCFTRIFAPRNFRSQVYARWFYEADGSHSWSPSDRIALTIYGGRGEGFRGMIRKDHYAPGLFRVNIETDDGRTFGTLTFRLEADDSTDPRDFRDRSM